MCNTIHWIKCTLSPSICILYIIHVYSYALRLWMCRWVPSTLFYVLCIPQLLFLIITILRLSFFVLLHYTRPHILPIFIHSVLLVHQHYYHMHGRIYFITLCLLLLLEIERNIKKKNFYFILLIKYTGTITICPYSFIIYDHSMRIETYTNISGKIWSEARAIVI